MSGHLRSLATWSIILAVAGLLLASPANAALDFIISAFSVAPDPSDLGSAVTATTTVANLGGSYPYGEVYVGFWKHSAAEPTGTPAPDHEWVFCWCEEADLTSSWSFTPSAIGSYTAWAWADYNGYYTESDETNNKASDGYSVVAAQPKDLVISAFSVTPDPGGLGAPLSATVTLQNPGPGNAGSFYLNFWKHSATEPTNPDTYSSRSLRPGLSGGTQEQYTFSFTQSVQASYKAWVWADAYNVVTETNETNNKASDDYSVIPLPDLIVSSLSVSPDPSYLGTSLTAKMKGYNDGDVDAAGPFYLDFWQHRDTAPTDDSGHDARFTVPILLINAYTPEYTYSFTPGAAGSYQAWAFIDSTNAVQDGSESNNTRSDTYEVYPPPDLIISAFSVTPATSDLGTTLRAAFKVKNQGAGPATGFYVGFWEHLSSPPGPGDYPDIDDWYDGLAPGEETPEFRWNFTPYSSGNLKAWVMADCYTDVAETDETNNTASYDYTVNGPDLTIAHLDLAPNPSNLGSSVTATVRAGNPSTINSPGFYVGFLEHSASTPIWGNHWDFDKYWWVSSLSAGTETADLTYPFTPADSGTFTAWAVADTDDHVGEQDEGNNTASYEYTVVPQADLVVSDLWISPDPSRLGTSVTANARGHNQGDLDAGASNIDFWQHRDTAPTDDSGHDHRWSIASLLADNYTSYLTYSFTPGGTGTFKAWAFIDSTNAVAEGNETNNTRSDTYEVTLPPDLVISQFSVTPATSNLGTTVRAAGKARNDGAGPADEFYVGYWGHRSNPPGPGDWPWDEWWFGGLAPGAESSQFRFDFMPSGPGTFQAWARADCYDYVDEGNETNNNASAAYQVLGPPDLIVSRLDIAPSPAVLGSEITATLKGKNQGDQPAGAFDIDFWQHRDSAPTTFEGSDAWWQIAGLAAGAETPEITYGFTPAGEGSFRAWALIDSLNSVAEHFEDNNTRSFEYGVGAAPDLVVSHLDITPNPGSLGSNVTAGLRGKNAGGAPTTTYCYLGFWEHRTSVPGPGDWPDDGWWVDELGPGEETGLAEYSFAPAAVGSYTAWGVIDYTDRVLESDGANNSKSKDYSVLSMPDLVVSLLNVTPDPSQLGQQLTATAKAKNEGTAGAGAFDVAFWKHRPTAPTTTDEPSKDTSWSIPSLAAGAETSALTYAFTPVGGSYKAWALADSTAQVAESREDNNTRSDAYRVYGPDLIVSQLQVAPDPANIGQTITATLRGKNRGSVAAGPFDLAFWKHRASEPTDDAGRDTGWTVDTLGAGAQTAVLNYDFTAASAGSYKAWAFIDSKKQITESSETNNTRSDPYVVGAVPDLVVSALTIAPDPSDLGAALTATAKAKNQGNTAAGAFNLGFWRHRDSAPTSATGADTSWPIAGLAAGAETPAQTYAFTPALPGGFRAWAFADSGKVIAEAAEDNNTRDCAYTVRGPDLAIAGFWIDPDPANLGQWLDVDLCVENQGTAAAGPFATAFWRHRDAAPTDDSGKDVEWISGGLGPGDDQWLDYDFTPATRGSFRAWAFADSTKQVTELDEANNIDDEPYVVAGPDLVVSELTVAPSPAALGVELTAIMKGKNVGDGPAGGFFLAFWRHRTSAPTDEAGHDARWAIPGLAPDEETPALTHLFTPAAAGSYQAWAFADSGAAVVEVDETNNTRDAAYRVDGADLVVSALAVAPDPSGLGTALTATVKGRNDGTAAAGAFTISLWQHRSSAPTDALGRDASWDLPGLAPAAETTALTHDFTPAGAGSFQAWALIDSGKVIAELDETNNTRSDDYAVQAPDLIVSEIEVTPETSSLGTALNATVQGKNIGDAAAGTFRMNFWTHYDTEPTDDTGSVITWEFSSLAPGAETIAIPYGFMPAAPGNYQAWAFIDVHKVVAESNEGNNTASAPYSVRGPDLVISQLDVAPETSNLGTGLNATVRAANNGDGASGPFTVSFWRHRDSAPTDESGRDTSWVVGALDSCVDTGPMTYAFTPGAAGSFQAWAFADSGLMVRERDETNNALGDPYTVNDPFRPDSWVRIKGEAAWLGDNIYATYATQRKQKTVTAGTTAVFELCVQNDAPVADSFLVKGPAGASGWTVRYFDSLIGGIDITGLVTGPGWPVGPLAPAATRDFRVEVTPPIAALGGAKQVLKVSATSQTSPTRWDGVQADTVVAIKAQPDGRIKQAGQPSWIGDNIYNTTGNGQESAAQVIPGAAAIYWLSWQNDGNVADQFKITGPAGASGWTITYFNAWTGGANITAAVTSAAGWKTRWLNPGQEQQMRVEVRPASSVPVGTALTTRVTGASTKQATKKDCVRGKTTRRA